MTRPQFDRLDCRILHQLARNARKPFLEIARMCNVSGAAIHQRVQKLQASGVIKGFETEISPEALGYDTCAYVGLLLSDPSQSDVVTEQIGRIPEVTECHLTTGKYDIMLKIYARNNSHLLELLHDRIQSIVPGRTETLISFKEEFRRQLPLDENCNAE